MSVILVHASRRHGGRLYQGGAMSLAHLSEGLYDVVVLCADELQPDAQTIAPPNVRIVPAPNDDSGEPFTREQQAIAENAAAIVAEEYTVEKRILVSCFAGRNRSGLVMAMAIHLLSVLEVDHE